MARFFECFRCRHEIVTAIYRIDDFDPQHFFCSTGCLGQSRQRDAEFTPQPLDDSVGAGIQQGDHSRDDPQYGEQEHPLQVSDAHVWREVEDDGNRQMG